MTHEPIQERAPGATAQSSPRRAQPPATPPPSGGRGHQATQVVTLDSAPPVPSDPAPASPAGETLYTLAEARRLLDEQDCARHGHDLEQVRWGAGPVVRVCCTRCPVTFVPPELPPLPPDHELREDVFRAGGGPGSVRTTHIPTGIVAVGEGGKTEMDNQGRARLILRARLYIASLEREAKD